MHELTVGAATAWLRGWAAAIGENGRRGGKGSIADDVDHHLIALRRGPEVGLAVVNGVDGAEAVDAVVAEEILGGEAVEGLERDGADTIGEARDGRACGLDRGVA